MGGWLSVSWKAKSHVERMVGQSKAKLGEGEVVAIRRIHSFKVHVEPTGNSTASTTDGGGDDCNDSKS